MTTTLDAYLKLATNEAIYISQELGLEQGERVEGQQYPKALEKYIQLGCKFLGKALPDHVMLSGRCEGC